MAGAIRRFLIYLSRGMGGSIPLLLLLLLTHVPVTGQGKEQLTLYPTLGLNGRPPSQLVRTGFSTGNLFPQFSATKNVGGVGLNFGLQVEKGKFGLEYYPTLRYTEWYRTYKNLSDRNYKFMFDQNFQVYLNSKFDIGVGYSIVNHGQTYPITRYDSTIIHRSIEFPSVNAFIALPIRKIVHLEVKVQYVPRGYFPHSDMDDTHILFNFRAYYRFDFLNEPDTGFFRESP